MKNNATAVQQQVTVVTSIFAVRFNTGRGKKDSNSTWDSEHSKLGNGVLHTLHNTSFILI
jgi:hypothetical protein